MANTLASPSWLSRAAMCKSRVKRSASAGAASMLRIMWSYHFRRQLPANSEPVYRPAEELSFPIA